ncbi:MAG: type II toxin-antitoxin system YafQ family toxin [Eubacteriales bacterium]|nr:type II toxin-antitoxin system YafQ family toxin [Eubacteriales bacterium]
MRYELHPTATFRKDLKRVAKRGLDLSLLKEVIDVLAEGGTLDDKYRDHELSGNYRRRRECHILPDWLLIYEYDRGNLILILTRTGTHSDLFNK